LNAILVVGITPAMKEGLKRKFPGIPFRWAETGQQALSIWIAQQPKALITLQRLPDMTGADLLTRADGSGIRGRITGDGTFEKLLAAVEEVLALEPDPLVRTPTASNRLSPLRALFARQTTEHMGHIRRAEAELSTGSLSPSGRVAALRAAHELAAAGVNFGSESGTQTALQLEELLRAGSPDRLANQFSLLVKRLERELSAEPFGSDLEFIGSEHLAAQRSMLLVAHDRALNKQLQAACDRDRLELIHASTVTAAREAVAQHRPDVAVVDLGVPEGQAGGFTLIAELHRLTPPVPVLVLIEDEDSDQRVHTGTHGTLRFLRKPLPAKKIMDDVWELLVIPQETRPTILAVEDDPLLLGALNQLLQPLAVNLVICSDRDQFWSALSDGQPDLILLNHELSEGEALDLCRAVKSNPQYDSLPVLMLMPHADETLLKAIFAAGADDFIRKPVSPTELVLRVRSHLERRHLLHRIADTDLATGAYNRRKFADLFHTYQRKADEKQLPLSLAILDMDRLKLINETYSYAMGDLVLQRMVAVLKRFLRDEDLVARCSSKEFIVGMLGVNKATAAQRLTMLISLLQQDPQVQAIAPTFSGGVAEYRVDGTSLHALHRAASAALDTAKQLGSSDVTPAVNEMISPALLE
jgi:diguanylate cyclase (GGDEF)-like protein